MNIFRRAWTYVIRQKLRSFILLLVLLLMGTLVLTGLSIMNSSKEAAKDIRTSIGGTINLSLDNDQSNYDLVESNSEGQSYQYVGDKITKKTIEDISSVKGVKYCNSEMAAGAFCSPVDFKYLPTQINEMPGGTDLEGVDDSSMSVVLSSERFSGFRSGKIKLKDGRHITPDDENVILISNELAEYNDLSVGDEIVVQSAATDKNTKLKIIGIFTGTEGLDGEALLPSDKAGNQGIIDFKSREDINGGDYGFHSNLVIEVDDPQNIDQVYDKIARLTEVKGKTFTLKIDNENYDAVEGPLTSMQDLVRTLIIVTILVSSVVLVLLLALWIKNRVRETGILMSIGVSKTKIISQFILEVLLIAVIAFGLSYFCSTAIADTTNDFIKDKVIESEHESSASEERSGNTEVFNEDSLDQLGGGGEVVPEMPQFDVDVDPHHLIWVYLIGLGMVLLSTTIASYSIIRMRPKDILSRMS